MVSSNSEAVAARLSRWKLTSTFTRGLLAISTEAQPTKRSLPIVPSRSLILTSVPTVVTFATLESVTAGVYSTGVYAARGQNPTTNTGDMVFSDGTSTEMATLAGNVTTGYTASLTIAV